MDPRTVARGVAAGRVAFGVALTFAPRFVMRRAGETLDPPRPYGWWLRAVGVRDLVLGTGAMLALDGADPVVARTWVGAGAVTDTADAAMAIVSRRDLDGPRRALIVAVAGAAATAGWWAAAGLPAD